MEHKDYWAECLSNAAEECDLSLTKEQLESLATAAMYGHEHYGMAFYSPPPSDRISVIRQEEKEKLAALQRDYDEYKNNAETAIKKALRQYPDAVVSIHEDGEVLRHGGRTDRIQ